MKKKRKGIELAPRGSFFVGRRQVRSWRVSDFALFNSLPSQTLRFKWDDDGGYAFKILPIFSQHLFFLLKWENSQVSNCI